jgi:hypothetical protein
MMVAAKAEAHLFFRILLTWVQSSSYREAAAGALALALALAVAVALVIAMAVAVMVVVTRQQLC